jgi:hypothetical protein
MDRIELDETDSNSRERKALTRAKQQAVRQESLMGFHIYLQMCCFGDVVRAHGTINSFFIFLV